MTTDWQVQGQRPGPLASIWDNTEASSEPPGPSSCQPQGILVGQLLPPQRAPPCEPAHNAHSQAVSREATYHQYLKVGRGQDSCLILKNGKVLPTLGGHPAPLCPQVGAAVLSSRPRPPSPHPFPHYVRHPRATGVGDSGFTAVAGVPGTPAFRGGQTPSASSVHEGLGCRGLGAGKLEDRKSVV